MHAILAILPALKPLSIAKVNPLLSAFTCAVASMSSANTHVLTVILLWP